MRLALLALAGCASSAAPDFSVEAPAGPVGFDAPFRLETRGAGDDVTWRQVGGPPLSQGSGNGRSFSGRTHRLDELRPGPLPWGVVPFSPATQGEYLIEARWRGATRTVRVIAAPRATGVPSVAVGAPVLLGGEGWRLADGAAPGATLAGNRFTAARAGRWELRDGAGRALALRANRYDDTPLDCGRAECHPAAAAAARASPMTRILYRGLEGELGAGYDPRCAIACHAAGEPGVGDGGFVDVAAQLGFALPARPRRGAWDELPRALRRVGGVTCTTCHGPGAIPEDAARWSILRADVCATCHDAPPRYPLVAGWRASRMSRADAAAGTTAERCRACHTTGGFLDAAGVRPLGALPPPEAGPLGVACAACHAAHGSHGASALLRDVAPPPALGVDLPPAARASAVCLRCHAPLADGPVEGAAAALWLGRGGVRVADGAPFAGAAPHATVPCAGCHDAKSHTFAVPTARCTGCHAKAPRVDAALAGRAQALWTRLGGAGRHPAAAPPGDERRARDVALVLEDPAAAIHNGPYARALLDEAEAPSQPP